MPRFAPVVPAALALLLLGARPASADASISELVSAERMKEVIEFLADEDLGGRIPGSPGHARARAYLIERMRQAGLEPAGDDGGYEQVFEMGGRDGRFQRQADGSVVPNECRQGFNLVGRLPGSDPERSAETIVFMAHYDHIGVTADGDAYNGAYDNASGVAVALEIARVLAAADRVPARSILFILTDGEEAGLLGAKAWIADPTVPLEHVVLAISADPLGRRIVPDYGAIVLSGIERSPELQEFWRQTEEFADSDVVFVDRALIPVFASDHDAFFRAATGIPAFWFVNPGFTYYHEASDSADTIDYRMLVDDVRYMARSLVLVGDSTRRFEDSGPPAMGARTAADARRLVAGMAASETLDDDERARALKILADLDSVVEADSLEPLGNAQAYFYGTIKFLLFDLGKKYPGPVPPPFPGRSAEDAPDEERSGDER